MRQRLSDSLKTAMKAKQDREVQTVRLILAALKDRDIAARGKGNANGVADDEILQLLQSMVKQRRESIALFEQGGRLELAQQEADEITIIERFLPKQMSEAEATAAIKTVIADIGATSIKDMGKVMAALRSRFAGQMDFAKVGPAVKAQLGG